MATSCHAPSSTPGPQRFEAVEGGTRITLRWIPIDPTADQAASFVAAMESMTGGWSGSFDKLDSYLAG